MPNTNPVILEKIKAGETIYCQVAKPDDLSKPGELLVVKATADAVVTETEVTIENEGKPLVVNLAIRELFDHNWFYDEDLAKATIVPMATALTWTPRE